MSPKLCEYTMESERNFCYKNSFYYLVDSDLAYLLHVERNLSNY